MAEAGAVDSAAWIRAVDDSAWPTLAAVRAAAVARMEAVASALDLAWGDSAVVRAAAAPARTAAAAAVAAAAASATAEQ